MNYFPFFPFSFRKNITTDNFIQEYRYSYKPIYGSSDKFYSNKFETVNNLNINNVDDFDITKIREKY